MEVQKDCGQQKNRGAGSRKVMAVLDPEEEYLYRLMEYLNQRRSLPFEIQAFTSTESLSRAFQNSVPEILLLAEKTDFSAAESTGAKKVIWLTETRQRSGNTVWKYQPAADLVQEIMDIYAAEEPVEEELPAGGRTAEKIAVFSPGAGHAGTVFAAVLALVLAEEKRVLYLNLHAYAGFEQIMGREAGRTLSDLLYFYRQKKGNVLCHLNGILQTLQKLDYVPPVQLEEDLFDVPGEDWIGLAENLAGSGAYETVVFDLGECVQGKREFLRHCGKVYLPEEKGMLAQAQLDAFLRDLPVEETGRYTRVRMPEPETVTAGSMFFEGMLWGRQGDYVRKILQQSYRDAGKN